MKKALVEPSGRIAQVEPINADPKSGGIPFPVHEALKWVDVPDDTSTFDTWNGKQVVKYVAPAPFASVDTAVTQTQLAAALEAAGVSAPAVDAAITAVKATS